MTEVLTPRPNKSDVKTFSPISCPTLIRNFGSGSLNSVPSFPISSLLGSYPLLLPTMKEL